MLPVSLPVSINLITNVANLCKKRQRSSAVINKPSYTLLPRNVRQFKQPALPSLHKRVVHTSPRIKVQSETVKVPKKRIEKLHHVSKKFPLKKIWHCVICAKSKCVVAQATAARTMIVFSSMKDALTQTVNSFHTRLER